jgi:hypothetical protein
LHQPCRHVDKAIDVGHAPTVPTLPDSLGADHEFGLDVLVENASGTEAE